MEFTFGIITTNETNQYLPTIINQIKKEVPYDKREIIVVGGDNPNIDGVIHIEFDESQKPKWITKKKNLITQYSTKENIVYLHDYIGFHEGWYRGQVKRGNDFFIRMDKIINYDGSRFRDWTIWPHNGNEIDDIVSNGRQCLLPYHTDGLSKFMYISGTYWIAKKDVMLKHPLNENLGWGQSEDVEWSKIVRERYDFQMNQHSTVKILKSGKHRVFNEMNQNTLKNILSEIGISLTSNYITKTNLSNGPQLGSQMMQYAGMYALSKLMGYEIVFLEKYFNVFRGVKLFNSFNIVDKIINEDINFSKFQLKDTLVDTDVFSLDTNLNWDIGGWFHTYHYFKDYESDIIDVFKFKDDIYSQALNNINKIRNNETYPIVSLHVRRGDYLKVASLNLPISYYESAINIFLDMFDYSYFKLLVFSDDIDWCKSNIKGENVLFSENNSDYIDMCMMSMCDHNIIANSTFSWWGAFLNKNKNKVVVCPKEYVGTSDNIHQFLNGNYYPKNWTPITVI